MSLESWVNSEATRKLTPARHPLSIRDLQEVWEIVKQMKKKGIWQRGNEVKIYFNESRRFPIDSDVYNRFAFYVCIDDYYFGVCYRDSRGRIGKRPIGSDFPKKYFVNMTILPSYHKPAPVGWMGPEYLSKIEHDHWMSGDYVLLLSNGYYNAKPALEMAMEMSMVWRKRDLAAIPILAAIAYIISVIFFPFGYLYSVTISHYEVFPLVIFLWGLTFAIACATYIEYRVQLRRERWFFETLASSNFYPGR